MSTRCTGLSKSWWWLLMLLGLVLLYFFMLSAKQVLIEHDLQARVQQQLQAAGITGAKVVLERRGRDVLLSGSVATEQERNYLIQLAEKVVGVRVVDDGIHVPLQEKPTLVLTSNQQKIVLSGVFPSQEQINDLVHEARSVYGANNVDNQLTVGDNIASPRWLSDSALLLPVLYTVDKATLTLEKGLPFLSATVYSEAEKMALHQRVEGLLSMPITEKIVIDTSTESESADVIARMVNGKLLLEGKLASKAEIDAMLALLSKPLGVKIIDNQLTVSQRIASEKGRLTLSGQVDNIMHIKLRLAARNVMKSMHFVLQDDLVEKNRITKTATSTSKDIKEKPVNVAKNAESAESAENVILASAMTLTKQENEEAITACQRQIDQAMSGKSIHFASDKSTIKKESVVLLKELVNIIGKCKSALSGSEILISGYTDSKGNDRYNEKLSQRRANAVKRYFKKAGVAQNLLRAKGFGEAQPIASNSSKEGRAKNRRITFSIANKQLVSN